MRKIGLFFLMQVFVLGLYAQKIEVTSGTFDFLKGQKELKVSYDYSNMSVGKFDKEEDYVAEKAADYNSKEAGKGDKWKEAWVADRAGRYEPKFELLFNENGKGISCKQSANAEYEMIVHTTFVEPGFNVGVMRKPAYLNAEIKFVNISTGKEEALLAVKNCPGRDAAGFDFDTGYRIEEGYAKLGKSTAAFLNKKLK
ncbi:MAG: hypothetical protein HC906_19040 [Bacteroidales bacterium]|nr:hypothetical protein [Bacteroidales bacterium]